VVALLLLVKAPMLLSVVQLPFVREQLKLDNWTPNVEQGIIRCHVLAHGVGSGLPGRTRTLVCPRASSRPHI